MRYTQLRAFDAVAREASFSEAASRLGLTQPALTIQVRTLETAYGTKLFVRRPGGVDLTKAGRDLFQMTRELFSVEERIQAFLTGSAGLEQGELRLSADGPHLAMELIAAYRRRYPNVTMAIALGNAHDVWRDLIEGRADAVVVANPPETAGVEVLPIHHRRLSVVVGQDHPWAGRRGLPLKGLAGTPTVLREARSNTRQTLDRVLSSAGIRLDVVLELGSREATIEAVAAGLGIGFVFEGEVPADPRVAVVPIKDTGSQITDTVACLKGERESAVVDAFFQVASAWKNGKRG